MKIDIKKYPADSAGRLMVQNIPIVNYNETIDDIEKKLFGKASNFSTINYIHIVDDEKHLLGIFSIKEIFNYPKNTPIKKIPFSKKIVSTLAETDKEQATILALKNNLKSLPVVDENNCLLGVIPNDTILKTIYQEMHEDILHISGISQEDSSVDAKSLPIIKTLKRRLPWLIFGMMGGILAAEIVGLFEEMLSNYIILVAFIPLITYMSGASCSQMQAFIIRDLALNPKLKFLKYLFKQFGATILIGISMSGILYITSLGLYGKPMISFVLAIALLFAITSSLLTGIIIPFLFTRLKLDPADASGPVGTIIQDTISVFVYLIVAFWLL